VKKLKYLLPFTSFSYPEISQYSCVRVRDQVLLQCKITGKNIVFDILNHIKY
jgi:hypothetical protein